MEIAPNIHRIEAPLGERFVCMFLLDGDECALLIDTGMDSIPGEYLAPYLDAIGIPADKIRYVLISHADFDHMAGNGALKEDGSQCAIYVSPPGPGHGRRHRMHDR